MIRGIRDAIITIRKPNKIYVFDGANVYKSDGRTVQTRRDKFVVRKATQDERKCITRQFQDLMRGFEAFYAPRANVKCVGASQPVAHRDDCVAINIIVDGTPCSIYVSNKTGLPISTQTEGKARRWYAQVKLGIPVKDQFFRESIKPRS